MQEGKSQEEALALIEPFGYRCCLFIGDSQQLPGISKRSFAANTDPIVDAAAARFELSTLPESEFELLDSKFKFTPDQVEADKEAREVFVSRLSSTIDQFYDAPHWRTMMQLPLHRNMRAREDPDFASLLDSIRQGTCTADQIGQVLERCCRFHDCGRSTPEAMSAVQNSLSLVSTNAQLHEINERCIQHAVDGCNGAVLASGYREHRAVCTLVSGSGELIRTMDMRTAEDRQMLNGILTMHRKRGNGVRPRPLTLRLAPGCPVVILANDYPQIGIATGVSARVVSSVCNKDGHKGYVTLEIDNPAPSQPKHVYCRPSTQLVPTDSKITSTGKRIGR